MFHHMFLSSWDAPAESAITVASVNPTQVVVALAGGHLVYLDVEDGAISEVRHNMYIRILHAKRINVDLLY